MPDVARLTSAVQIVGHPPSLEFAVTRSRAFRSTLLFLTLQLGACLTWSPVTATPESLFQQPEPPERVRVTGADGVPLVLERPVIRAGALVATAAPGAILIGDVETLEVEKVSVLRTIGLTLPGAVILALVGIKSKR